MIKLYLYVSDVIHVNEQTKYVNCGLYVNFWNFSLTSFGFVINKKDHLKQNLLHLLQVRFKYGKMISYFLIVVLVCCV